MGAAAAAGGLSAAGGIYSAVAQGQAGRAQEGYYSYLADTARTNAGLSEKISQAERQNLGRAAGAAQLSLRKRIDATIGAQRAAVVNGVGSGSRSAQKIIKDTINEGNLDEMALRLNIDTRSRSAEIAGIMGRSNALSEATGYNMAGRNARTAARYGQVGSLLGAAGKVANSWYMGSLAGRGGGVKSDVLDASVYDDGVVG